MAWIRVECQLGHQQAIVFRPLEEGQHPATTHVEVNPDVPNDSMVIHGNGFTDEDVERYASIMRLAPQYCGVCKALLTIHVEPGDGPPGADMT